MAGYMKRDDEQGEIEVPNTQVEPPTGRSSKDQKPKGTH